MITESPIVESINRQLKALDEDFASDENGKSGRLQLAEYTKRRGALLKRLRDQEAAPPAPPPAPALSVRELDAILRPPQLPNLSGDDRRELDAFNRNFNEAINSGDIAAARTIQKDPRRESLAQNAQLARASETLRGGYKTSGARSLVPMLAGVIGVLTHELNETRMSARVDRAARLDPLKAFEEMSARIKELETAVPRYLGVHRSGATYARNAICTFGGSMWISLTDDNGTRPPSDSWQQCVKGTR